MTTDINKYHTSKIYKISSPQCDKFYIGSTTKMKLEKRLWEHKADYKRYIEKGIGSCMTSFEIIKFEDVIIELIKDVKCENRKELDIIEGECIKEYHDRILNKNVAGRTHKEWCETNKDIIKEYSKEYRKENKDKKKEWNEANKEKIKEQTKEYRKANKDIIKEKNKEYRKANKDIIKDKYEANKEKINEKIDCECGGKYTFTHRLRHEKSQKHQSFINL